VFTSEPTAALAFVNRSALVLMDTRISPAKPPGFLFEWPVMIFGVAPFRGDAKAAREGLAISYRFAGLEESSSFGSGGIRVRDEGGSFEAVPRQIAVHRVRFHSPRKLKPYASHQTRLADRRRCRWRPLNDRE
jgi:hypothetical protein